MREGKKRKENMNGVRTLSEGSVWPSDPGRRMLGRRKRVPCRAAGFSLPHSDAPETSPSSGHKSPACIKSLGKPPTRSVGYNLWHRLCRGWIVLTKYINFKPERNKVATAVKKTPSSCKPVVSAQQEATHPFKPCVFNSAIPKWGPMTHRGHWGIQGVARKIKNHKFVQTNTFILELDLLRIITSSQPNSVVISRLEQKTTNLIR